MEVRTRLVSFGDLEYQEHTSNALARILKGMRQEQIILDAVQNPIDDVEEYPDARLVESQTGTKDMMGAVTFENNKNWTLPSEPNHTTKLWLWFREGWRLKDHSLKGNEAFAEQVEPSPYPVLNYVPIRRKVNDDGVTDGRLYGIINGLSQYYRVKDAPTNRITDLLETDTDICFSIFFSTFEDYIINDETGLITLFSKIDDDQLQNAIRVDASPAGSVIFSLIYKGNAYQVSAPDNTIPPLDPGEFFDSEFDPEQFKTTGDIPDQFDPDTDPGTNWTWLFFTFNKTSRILRIYKVAGNFAAAELVASSNLTGVHTTFSLHIPGNEGGTDATTAYDIINDNDAVFGTSPTNNPDFVTGGGIRFNQNTETATIANHTSIDALSVFTIAYKVKLYGYSPDANIRAFISKAVNTTVGQPNGSFVMYQGANGVPWMGISIKNNAGVARTVQGPATQFNTLNTWHTVIWTYDGSNHNLYINGISGPTLAAAGEVFTNTLGMKIGATISNGISAINGELAHFVVDKGTAWNSSQRAWFTALQPGFKAGFPDWKPPKPPEPEEPVPVVRPLEKVYEVNLLDTTDTVKVNNPASATPFVSEYNVAAGTASTTPEVLKYDVADGTTGGGSTNPISTIYNLAAASSTGDIQSGETAYVQRIQSTSSVLYNKKPTDMQFWVADGGGDPNGMVYVAIVRSNGSYTKLGSGISASSLSSSWTSIQGVSYVDRTALANGDGVGIVREGHSQGVINVRRGGTGNHYDENGDGSVQYSWQHILDGTSWSSDNDDYSIAGVVKIGGETVSGSNPYYKMGADKRRLAIYQLNSTIENIAPSKVIWRARRLGSAASATVICTIRNSSDAIVYTFPQTISFNSIGTTVQDVQFDNVDQTVQWADGFRLCLEYGVITGINDTTNCLEVNFNVGPSNAGVVGGTSLKAQVYDYNASFPSFSEWKDLTPVGTDWAGKVYIGGASFTSYKDLDNTCTRVGEKVAQFTSPNISRLFGDKLSKWNVILKKEGSPTGQIRIKCYNGSGAESAVFNTILDAESLTTSDVTYVFTYPTNNFVMDGNSRIVVEYTNGTATDKVLVKINTDAIAGASGDGTKSVLTSFKNGVWIDEATLDVSGEIFTGGVPDQLSRPKVAVRCDSIFSQIYQDKITKCDIKLKKLGAPTGTYYVRSVRGSDGSNRDLIGSGDIAALSTSTWTLKNLSNTDAIHYMGVSDKIVVEYEGGDINNCLLVQVKKDSTYDDEDTRYEEFNGVSWVKDGFETWDLGMTLWKGGDTYTPDAGTPYVEPPDYYDHDLLIGAGAYILGGFESFYGMRIRDFRIFTEAWTLEEIDTVFDNRYSKRGAKGNLALVGYFTLNDETEPPET